MNTITPFKANLLQDPGINKTPAPSVDEILKTPAVNHESPKKSGVVPKFITVAATLILLGISARKGLFGKHIQRFFGGGIKKLSPEKINEIVTSKLNTYAERGDKTPFEIKTLGNGKTRASRIKSNGNREVIIFNADSGLPDRRIEFKKPKGKKTLEYTSWKGNDILDENFDEVNNFYKKFKRDKMKRKHLFGSKYTQEFITYGDMVNGNGQAVLNRRKYFYNDGKNLNKIIDKNCETGDVSIRELLYGKDKKVQGFDLIAGDNGTIIRKINGQVPMPVSVPNRKNSLLQKFLEFFSIQKTNMLK